MNAPSRPSNGLGKTANRDGPRGQRFGHVTGHQDITGEPGDRQRSYLVQDEETGLSYSFGYADIVTEGLRTIRTGERIRFLIDPGRPRHASYVIRLDLPDTAEYYQ
jgi:hypothetical protein